MLTKQQQLSIDILNDLHRNWTPHDGQLKVGRELINGKSDTLFIQCGRKWGKSEFAIYILWRHALLHPKSACYYVTPTMTHGRRFIWTDPRLTTFGPNKYIDRINSNEMILRFKNGSFIQVLGSENFQSANGLRPSFLVYDEFSEFHPRFHETMNPNRIVYKCPLVIIGTPPTADSINKSQYLTYAQECQDRTDSIWIRQSSYSNPHIPKEELDREREKLFQRGEEWIWYSQYEARITAGGRNVVFPMFSPEKHVVSHDILMAEISRDAHKLQWYCITDPGTTTTMAVLFVAVNPHTKKIYVVDEIYEQDARQTSVSLIMPRILKRVKTYSPTLSFDEDWYKVYDEAAAWFCNEVAQQFEIYFQPTLKAHNKKENGISLMKDIFIHNVIQISDRCSNFQKEIIGYVADENGKFPKLNDHLLDCFRYFLAAAHYSMVQVMEAVRVLGARIPGDKDPPGYQRPLNKRDLEEFDWTAEYE